LLYFIDESGSDLRQTPCKVIAGIAVAEEKIWDLVTKAIELKKQILGMQIIDEWEPKGSSLLKSKNFKLASQSDKIIFNERFQLLQNFYTKNKLKRAVTREELTAFGQACIDYVENVLGLCSQYDIRVFESVFPRDGIPTMGSELKKDYAYLFQRIYCHLYNISDSE
jgi:hypothetical protein